MKSLCGQCVKFSLEEGGPMTEPVGIQNRLVFLVTSGVQHLPWPFDLGCDGIISGFLRAKVLHIHRGSSRGSQIIEGQDF